MKLFLEATEDEDLSSTADFSRGTTLADDSMSSEQTIREKSLQSPSTDQGNVESTVRMHEESGDNFVNLLPTLKRCVDDLCRTIEWITMVPHRCNLGHDARVQVISFLLDNGALLNILAGVNPTVKGISINLRGCIGHIGYLNRTLCAYDKFVAKLKYGQMTILSASSTFHAKKAFLKFYPKYVRQIQAIAPYHESGRFAIDACRRLKKEWIENALNESIRPEVSESLSSQNKNREEEKEGEAYSEQTKRGAVSTRLVMR
ncbi:unnamed protein product [Rodentolepis nana]|uniref:ANK_REP_REGION domain-containing protein n=1 Tax=Rodentolepis nana TaxID=102285 RepID=A0A158QJH3_RODNA|nr:unnamed protein product [Rodentolepis nana]